MHSSLIGKIEKAKRYAEERERITFSDFTVSFQGEHDSYTLTYKDLAIFWYFYIWQLTEGRAAARLATYKN